MGATGDSRLQCSFTFYSCIDDRENKELGAVGCAAVGAGVQLLENLELLFLKYALHLCTDLYKVPRLGMSVSTH